MRVEIFFFVILSAAAFAQEDTRSDVVNTRLLEESERLFEIINKIINTPKEYEEMITERRNCLLWQFTAEKEALNQSTAAAVVKGMTKSNNIERFQSISNIVRIVFEKFSVMRENVPKMTELIIEKGVQPVMPYMFITQGLKTFLQDLYKRKNEAMELENNEMERLNIWEDIIKKLKIFEVALDHINDFLVNAKFKFFENYVNYVFQTENELKKIRIDACKKINACVAL